MEFERAVSIANLEAIAKEVLEPVSRAYYESGAENEQALGRNRTAFDHCQLANRVLVDVSRRSARTTLLGHQVSMPIAIAPTAFHRLAHPEGEIATRRAAAEAGTLMVLSTLSNTPVEEVAAAAEGPLWFQLYIYRDRGITRDLIARVEKAGCSALVLTVDAPVLGKRDRDSIHQFSLPAHLSVANMLPAQMESLPNAPRDSGLAGYFSALIDPSLCWNDLAWVAKNTSLPIVLKGVIRADDAVRARDAGCQGLIVSNHGGRQLDAAPATLDALPNIAQAVGTDIEVYLDGGVRRGVDAIKAIAWGARAVFVGRPILWGLACAGQEGVSRALAILADELDRALALCGCPTIADISADLLTCV